MEITKKMSKKMGKKINSQLSQVPILSVILHSANVGAAPTFGDFITCETRVN